MCHFITARRTVCWQLSFRLAARAFTTFDYRRIRCQRSIMRGRSGRSLILSMNRGQQDRNELAPVRTSKSATTSKPPTIRSELDWRFRAGPAFQEQKAAPQSVALPTKFGRGRIGRARLCRAAAPSEASNRNVGVLLMRRSERQSAVQRQKFDQAAAAALA